MQTVCYFSFSESKSCNGGGNLSKILQANQEPSAETSSAWHMIQNLAFESVPSKDDVINCELSVAVCVQQFHRIILNLNIIDADVTSLLQGLKADENDSNICSGHSTILLERSSTTNSQEAAKSQLGRIIIKINKGKKQKC